MASNKDLLLSRVESAAIDGRMRTLRFRQRQLQSLFKQISTHREDLVAATQRDNKCNVEEAQLMFAASLLEIRNHYDSLDLKTDLELEYRLAKGKSNEARRVPFGISYIIPDSSGELFSILSSLSAALSAGCCIAVELQNTIRETPSLLKRYLTESLDKDAFCVIDSRAPAEFLSKCVVVDPGQKLGSSERSCTQRWLSAPLKQNVAVIDRTSDFRLAAEEIVTSRLAFGGQGRYAVDVVLVNEFKAKETIDALIQVLEARQVGKQNQSRSFNKSPESDSAVIDRELESNKVKLVWGDSTRGIVEILDRSSSLLYRKPQGTTIVVNKFTSLDDAIDLLNNNNVSTPSTGAIYLFSEPREAKYLSQHIPNDVSFVNHIPSQLLIGPNSPQGYPISLYKRYTHEMFEYPSPQFFPSSRTHPASKVLTSPARIAGLVALAQKPLKLTGQPASGAWGFFEQGMILGALVYLLPIVSVSLVGIGYCGLYGYQSVFRS